MLTKKIFIPDISFIIPIQFPDNKISEELSNLKNLSFKKEIVVIDDYTDESTRNILREIQPTLKLKLILHAKTKGETVCIINGAAHAKGKYLCFIDQKFLDNIKMANEELRKINSKFGRFDLIVFKFQSSVYLLIKNGKFKQIQVSNETNNVTSAILQEAKERDYTINYL